MAEEHNGNHEDKESKELQVLLDPAYPLLQRFREACPGTYHHSQVVLGLVEGVSLTIGLNTLKMKIISTYHDIGKMFNPKYFVENQVEN
jgi:membrane-associated HD superfamily phosphohydrolase